MMAEALLMATTVWYIPGWMRTQEPQAGVLASVSNAFPNATVEFKRWDGDRIWPHAVASADAAATNFVAEIAAMPAEARDGLVVVGHSLGGRITARVLAGLAARNLKVRRGVLLAAAIPSGDADVAKMGGGSVFPVMAVCNPDDVTLRFVYALAGGESQTAYGANGSLTPLANVEERVTPPDIVDQVAIDRSWAKVSAFKEVANHHVLFYLDYLRRILAGEKPSGAVMVPQDNPCVNHKVVDAEIWWDVLARHADWKLEQHKITGHCRIVSPEKKCTAWGDEAAMRAAFAKVKAQLGAP